MRQLSIGFCVFASLWSLARSAAADDQRPAQSLLVRSQWVNFDVVGGRLTAHSARHRESKTSTLENEQLGTRESLAVSADQGVPSVSYATADAHQRVTIEFSNGNQVNIQREPLNNSDVVPLSYNQSSRRLRMVIGGDTRQAIVARSFWHLMLAAPNECREHLLPILSVLRPAWPLEKQCEELEAALIALAKTDAISQRQRWQELVEQMSSSRFRERQAADLELRAAGPFVLSYLNDLPRHRLTSEQRHRVRLIVDSLTVNEPDMPARVAAWSLLDKSIWLALLDRDDLATRQLAAQHLSRICGRPLDFDPAGERADREGQIQRLRVQLDVP